MKFLLFFGVRREYVRRSLAIVSAKARKDGQRWRQTSQGGRSRNWRNQTVGRFLVAWSVLCLTIAIFGTQVVVAQKAMSSTPDQIARGKYLVTGIAGCMDCHGPQLKGGPLPFGPVKGAKLPSWAPVAPPIAGFPQFSNDAAAIKFLQTGLMPDGRRPRLPMPRYRFNAADAAAVVAFIRSVPH
jgi:mono/diheme cytochrome c family protein